jgi:hypothetical protein
MDSAIVGRTDGAHLNDLAANEFDAIVFAQDSSAHHLVIVVNRE